MIILAAICGGLGLTMLPPIGPQLMKEWSIDAAQLGLLLSAFSVTSLILALPGGLLIQKLGLRNAGVLALATLAGGFLLGLVSPNLTLQVVSRILQGSGQALIAIVGPALIGATLSPEKRGHAMGLYTAAIPVAMLITYNLAPLAVQWGGWRVPWVVGAVFSLVLLAAWSGGMRGRVAQPEVAPRSPSLGRVLANPAVTGTALTLMAVAGSFMTLQLFIPTFLVQVRGMDPVQAGALAGSGAITGLVAGLAGGKLSDLLKNSPLIAQVNLGLLVVFLAATPFVTGWTLLIVILLTGFVPALVTINLLTRLTQEVAHGEDLGPAMGVVTFGQSLGLVLFPLLFGLVVKSWGWSTTMMSLASVVVAGLVITLIEPVRTRHIKQEG